MREVDGVGLPRLRWLEAAVAGRYGAVWPGDWAAIDVATDAPGWNELGRETKESYLRFRAPVGWQRVLPWSGVVDPVSLDEWLAATLESRPLKSEPKRP